MRASENLNPGQPPPPAEKSLNQQPADPRKRIYVLKHQAPLKMGTPYHQGGNNQVQNIPPERRLFAPVGPKWSKKFYKKGLNPSTPHQTNSMASAQTRRKRGLTLGICTNWGFFPDFPPLGNNSPQVPLNEKNLIGMTDAPPETRKRPDLCKRVPQHKRFIKRYKDLKTYVIPDGYLERPQTHPVGGFSVAVRSACST